MWKPRLNFITLHYAWIITCSLLAWPVIYPYGNLSAIDAFFFGASGSTESGLNTVDLKDLKTYQQVYIYVIPVITNLMFINIAVVVIRLYWFRVHLTRKFGPKFAHSLTLAHDEESAVLDDDDTAIPGNPSATARLQLHQQQEDSLADDDIPAPASAAPEPVAFGTATSAVDREDALQQQPKQQPAVPVRNTMITFDVEPRGRSEGNALRIPGPRERDAGEDFVEIPVNSGDQPGVPMHRTLTGVSQVSGLSRRRPHRYSMNLGQPVMTATLTIERAATSIFALGHTPPAPKRATTPYASTRVMTAPPPSLSRHATVGRNSKFHNLTSADREILGGIEYRALKLLLVIVLGYFIGLHVFGVVCLLPWIHNAPQKYLDYLAACGQSSTWWAIYSAQTMVDNLGFTLTPDSMATFKDATWPMLCMTFMTFAGNTFYPVFLRLIIWIAHKLTPETSAIKEDLRFLLDHPRRCYTLLFPSKPTWILVGILVVLNLIDILLIIILDMHNPAVNDLPLGPRFLSAIFQAASARHTGTSTLALADVNPAVQFSLLVMMYIAVFPIAISVRASNTYEEKSLGMYEEDVKSLNEADPRSYVMNHVRNQLSFDLWYIFLGTFILCIAESDRIMDMDEPSFSVFAVIFECVSAYGNVGLSLGHPGVTTSFCGQFKTFSKVVICLMMIRGRHRTLPYALDRAIMLPTDIQSPPSETSSDDSNDGASTEKAVLPPSTAGGDDDDDEYKRRSNGQAGPFNIIQLASTSEKFSKGR